MNYFRKIRIQEEGKENAYMFASDINNKETREGKCICVLLLIYHRERYGRDLSFKKKKDESARD